MKIKVGISNHHIHLTEEDYQKLFQEKKLTKKNDLSQLNEYASEQTVILKGPKNIIENVRILGPFRNYTQVELSLTDCYKLGIKAPIRNSGDLENAAEITIIGPKGKLVKNAGIIATRHIHINENELIKYGINSRKLYQAAINNEKGGVLNNINIKVDNTYEFELHIDTDDANALSIIQGEEIEIREQKN